MSRSLDLWSAEGTVPTYQKSVPVEARTRIGFQRFLLALLTIGFFYNAYRYPLQINNSGTSETYADTPLWLSLGKYLICALLLALGVLLRIGQRRMDGGVKPLHLLAYLFLTVFPVVVGLLAQEFDYVTIGFFFLVPILIHSFAGARLDFQRVNRYLSVVIFIAAAVEVVQIALFFLFGRLPALAQTASLSVRFGSFLDDPNGFGIVLCWFVPFSMLYFRGVSRWVWITILGLMLLLTQSLTSVGSFAFVMVAVAGIFISQRPRLVLPALVIATSTAAIAAFITYTYSRELMLMYDLFMLTKEGSIRGHAGALDVFGEVGLLNVLGLEPETEIWVETGYLNILSHFGLLYLAVLIAISVWAVGYYLKVSADRSRAPEIRTFALGAMGLLIAYTLGNLNLPLIEVFPVNLFAALLMGLASAGILEASDSPTEASRAEVPV